MDRINRIPQLAAEASLLPVVQPLELLLVLREDFAVERLERGCHVSRQDQLLLRINASYASGCRRDV